MDLDSVADDLYALPREAFTAARDQRVHAAREAGEHELAAQIGRLRKPSTAAWLTNLLARDQPAEVRGLVELGEALREAHDKLDSEALRRLSGKRHELVHALVDQARVLGRSAGHRVGEAVTRELEQTFIAALGDPDAARRLAAGRLATGLEPGGEWAWAPAAGAGPAGQRREPARRQRESDQPREFEQQGESEQQRESEQQAKRIERARRDLKTAREAAAGAEAERADAEQARADAEERETEAKRSVNELQAKLDRAERSAVDAAREVRSARRTLDTADRQARQARQRVHDLERRLEAMREG